jgi:hypothetical protein
MPKIDYSKTIIYQLTCPTFNGMYVNYTTNINNRKYKYSHMPELKKKIEIYDTIKLHGGFDNWKMIVLEKYTDCKSTQDAMKKVNEWINKLTQHSITNTNTNTTETNNIHISHDNDSDNTNENDELNFYISDILNDIVTDNIEPNEAIIEIYTKIVKIQYEKVNVEEVMEYLQMQKSKIIKRAKEQQLNKKDFDELEKKIDDFNKEQFVKMKKLEQQTEELLKYEYSKYEHMMIEQYLETKLNKIQQLMKEEHNKEPCKKNKLEIQKFIILDIMYKNQNKKNELMKKEEIFVQGIVNELQEERMQQKQRAIEKENKLKNEIQNELRKQLKETKRG